MPHGITSASAARSSRSTTPTGPERASSSLTSSWASSTPPPDPNTAQPRANAAKSRRPTLIPGAFESTASVSQRSVE